MTGEDKIAALRAEGTTAIADRAVRSVPPVWPLASSVAVNPFLGQTGETLAEAGARLARVAGAKVTMDRSWYAERIARGIIADCDLAAALEAAPVAPRVADVQTLKALARLPAQSPAAIPSVADLAARASGTDWPGLIADRVGAWAGAYFDEGQALWSALRMRGAWSAWTAFATHDLTPEIIGLRDFAAHVAAAPDSAHALIARAVDRLGLSAEALPTYFHALLMSLGGWAQAARYHLWRAELAGGVDQTGIELLAIRLTFEEALFAQHEAAIGPEWRKACERHAEPLAPSEDLAIDAVLQEAAERAGQRALATKLAGPAPSAANERPTLQAAFCIDVRSEVFRRALESVDPRVETLGFAGFFGLGTAHRRFASDVTELRLPVLLNPAISSISGRGGDAPSDRAARLVARARRAWGRFKIAAVSSFAFVEAAGPLYVGKLLRDSLRMGGAEPPADPAPQIDPAMPPDVRLDSAAAVLRAMSLTDGFANLVLIVGHGANVANNPHASALHCGACGGYSGDVNARLLAGLLNDKGVRAGLRERAIEIPDDTLFIGALHDTTTDAVTLYDADGASAAHIAAIAQAREWLAAAGALSRAERALRLPRAQGGHDVAPRSRDWAEIRPEWALAGCQAFIAAPRGRTARRSLDGRAFLHDYRWQDDATFGVLELIMTAPVVVASWISLQYYGSCVAPEAFGGGNKLLHNVVGGIGVVEGNGGLLRAGLPWQSVHNGDRLVHEPLRLSVCIEAPREAMSDILGRHPGVRALFDNRWMHLFAMDESGRLAWRYVGDLDWEPAEASSEPQRVRDAPIEVRTG